MYHSLNRPPASWPSSPSNTMYLQKEGNRILGQIVRIWGEKPGMEQESILTAYSSCPLGSCDEVPCTSPQTRDLVSRAQPCPLS